MNSIQPRANDKIEATLVRVIGANNEFAGTMKLKDALLLAQKLKTDLVEVSTSGTLSVCKLVSLGKFKYQVQKNHQKERPKHKNYSFKEIKLTPNIGKEDYETKLRQSLELLKKGNRVKITIRFRGRELCHKNLGLKLLDKIESSILKLGSVEFQRKEEERCVYALATLKQLK